MYQCPNDAFCHTATLPLVSFFSSSEVVCPPPPKINRTSVKVDGQSGCVNQKVTYRYNLRFEPLLSESCGRHAISSDNLNNL